MQESDDITLLRKYVDDESEEAFAALVARHIHKVYSVALRHTGSPSQAEEITQAVFIILARRSAALAAGWRRRLAAAVHLRGNGGNLATSLSGWLYQTARLTAVTFVRSAIRRTRREQEAYMQSVLTESEPEVWKQIAPLLDAAKAGLNETDRHAVVLRFFDGKSMGEIGAVLGANEDAAKKRVGRALEKLQKYFARRGVHSTTDTLAQAISSHSVQTAPALLIQTTTAVALAKSAAAGGSILTLVKATLLAMKTKTIILTTAAAVAAILLIGTGAYFTYQTFRPKAGHVAAVPSGTVPIKFANEVFTQDGDKNGTFIVELDPNTLRTSNSAPAIHIKGPIALASPNDAQTPAANNGAKKNPDNSSSYRFYVTNGSPLMGQHIRITFWLKTRDVKSWASAFLVIANLSNHWYANDAMKDRPIRGTTDWQQIEFVTDLPSEPCIIYFGPDLYGPGELWADDFQLDLAPPNAPITDDRNWHLWNQDAFSYSEADDFINKHNGHSTVCLSYIPDGPAPAGSFMWWGHSIREPDKYLGHTVRLTGWVKTEHLSGHLEPTFKPRAANSNILANDSMVNDSSLHGTRDWSQFSVKCKIPEDTRRLDVGFAFWGSGIAWIDMDSLKFEIIK